jgi:hypothetical protein
MQFRFTQLQCVSCTGGALDGAPISLNLIALQSDSFVDSVGVNMHVGDTTGSTYQTNPTLVQQEITRLGLRHARDEFDSTYQQSGGYAKMAAIAKNGTKFNLIADPRLMGAASGVLTQISEVGVSTVESVEGPNEYDISGDPNWQSVVTAYQASLYSTIAKAYPVLGFSIEAADTSAFPEIGNQSANMDFGSMHSYSYPGDDQAPLSTASHFASNVSNANIVASPKSLYATEYGYYTSTPPGVSQLAQSKYVPRAFLGYLAAGIKRTYVYELLDEFAVPSNTEDNFGLVTTAGVEKPAFTSLMNLMALLADPGATFQPGSLPLTITGVTANVNTLLFQKRNGNYYLAIWVEENSYNTSTKADIQNPMQFVIVSVPSGVASWNLYDPSISTTAQSSGTGSNIGVNVPDYPLILEIVP